MSSKGGSVAAAAPPCHGRPRFSYTPDIRHRQHQMAKKNLLPQKQCLQQWTAVVAKTEASAVVSGEKKPAVVSGEKKKLSEVDDSSMPPVGSIPPSILTPASTVKVTNLDRLMESVTPLIPRRYLLEVSAKKRGKGKVDARSFFCLEDLWESFSKWSAYGAGVTLLLNGKDPIEQYYVPFLSGIQLYIDPSKPSSRLRWPKEESDAELYRFMNSAASSKSDADRRAKSTMNLNVERLNGLSLGDKYVASSSGTKANIANSPGEPMFQFLEHDQPHTRRPLADKISILTSRYPDLGKCRSCDLLPTSWICVAWYPIYRIPMGPTLKDLNASFLTFHFLSTQHKIDAVNSWPGGIADPSAKISLPVFALASYKLKGSILSPCRPHECEQENSLLRAADDWLKHMQVTLPDYQFFHDHYSYWK